MKSLSVCRPLSKIEFTKTFLVLWTRNLTICLIGMFFTSLVLFVLGGRVNYTPSYPVGLYWTLDKTPEKGDLVTFCPADNNFFKEAKKRQYIAAGFCTGGYGELMKKIVALEGDTVTANYEGVTVNNVKLINSRNIGTDRHGRELGQYLAHNYKLSKGEVLLMSDYNASSFDGRYFGIQTTSQITNVVRPILTEGKK